MPNPLEPKAPPGPGEGLDPGVPPESAAGAPLVLIPVSAEDVARKTRRTKLIWTAAILTIAAIGGWFYKHSNDPIQAQQSFDAAQRLFDVARYEQAIVSCDRAIGLKPDFADAYLLRGRSRVARYDGEGAVADFSRAAELLPQDTRPLLNRASAYVDEKKYAEAIADTTAAIAIDSMQARAYNLRGTAMRATGQTEKAIADFTRAVELQPTSDNFFQRGATYQIVADHRHAVADFTQAISWDPDKPQAYFARAESERALGDTAAADKDHLQGRVLDGK